MPRTSHQLINPVANHQSAKTSTAGSSYAPLASRSRDFYAAHTGNDKGLYILDHSYGGGAKATLKRTVQKAPQYWDGEVGRVIGEICA